MRVKALAVAAALALIAAACSDDGGGGSSSGSDEVLDLAFYSDMSPPDPDTFYEGVGIIITTNVYDGLLRYKPDSTEIEGALAESWEVSDDGLSYTFDLRPDVTFHDGETVTSESVAFSLDRRLKIDGPGAYMVFDVENVETPDDQTVEIQLSQPNSAFLDYLAAPYGPKIVSQATIEENEVDGDLGAEYLETNDAGTGPYTIAEFNIGTGYVLDRYDDYWDGTPVYEQVDISIIPDPATQRLELEDGDLDIITHGLPVSDVQSFQDNDAFQVDEFETFTKHFLFVNANMGPFADPDVRAALPSGIDKTTVVDQVFGDFAVPSEQIYPAGMLPEDLARDDTPYDPEVLADAVQELPADQRNVDFAYDNAEPVSNRQSAEIIAAELEEAGLNVEVRGVDLPQVFDWPGQPDLQSDLYLLTAVPDAAHPDTWIRIFMRGEDAPFNPLDCTETPEADDAMDQGLTATTPEEVEAAYAEAGDAVVEGGCYITIADVQDAFVAQKGFEGYQHQLAAQRSTGLAELERST